MKCGLVMSRKMALTAAENTINHYIFKLQQNINFSAQPQSLKGLEAVNRLEALLKINKMRSLLSEDDIFEIESAIGCVKNILDADS